MSIIHRPPSTGVGAVDLSSFYNIASLPGSGTIIPDFSSSANFNIQMTASGYLANPIGASAGHSGIIMLIQNDAGDAEISFGPNYKWPVGAGTTMTAISGAVDAIPYFVQSETAIICQFLSDVG